MTCRLCLVGATGAVGTEFIRILERFKPDLANINLVASARSAGNQLTVLGREYEVQDIENYDFSHADIAFFTAGSNVSRIYAPIASAAKCTVIDNTSCFRMDLDKKLIIPQVNGHLLDNVVAGEIIANPNCSTIQTVKYLAPIAKAFGVEYAVCSTYQAAIGAGIGASDELKRHLSDLSDMPMRSDYFVSPLAMNVVPVIDELFDDGWTKEELKVVQETRKIIDDEKLAITATAVRVPVVTGHSVALYIKTEKPVDISEVHQIFKENDEVTLSLEYSDVPTPRFIKDPTLTYVGRLRLVDEDNHGLWSWIVADNLWVGAAYNGYQIIERLNGQSQIA